MSPFLLDKQLEKDTHEVLKLKLCTIRLMNDKRYIWFIMVPTLQDLTEIIDLTPSNQILLMQEISFVSEHLKTTYAPYKLNIAALGNMVSQLHIHVIGRRKNDPAWPGPVWGIGEATPYEKQEILGITNTFKLYLETENNKN